jgi:integrase
LLTVPVTPTRRPNAELRTREHLTPSEVEALIEAAKVNRHGQRDATMILVAFRHGLRAAEACDLRWEQVDFNAAVLHVRRVKNGTPSANPLLGDELRALRRLQRESAASPFVFVSEGGSPFATAGFARMVERVAAAASLELKVHPHMLCHACGYALANKGHDTRAIQGWLGHRSITSTAVIHGKVDVALPHDGPEFCHWHQYGQRKPYADPGHKRASRAIRIVGKIIHGDPTTDRWRKAFPSARRGRPSPLAA